jgi:hypothetical protein
MAACSDAFVLIGNGCVDARKQRSARSFIGRRGYARLTPDRRRARFAERYGGRRLPITGSRRSKPPLLTYRQVLMFSFLDSLQLLTVSRQSKVVVENTTVTPAAVSGAGNDRPLDWTRTL